MTKRMKKKLVAICISCAVVFTGPGMSMGACEKNSVN